MKTPAILQAFQNAILPSGADLLQADDPVAIGGHRLTGRLASSGPGVLYLARDRGAGLVTVRTTPAGTSEPGPVRARLRAEAACARRLPSSCTAPLLHDGAEETPPYLVSGYVQGPSLERVIDVTGPLPPAMVVALATDLARVLAAVHDAQVVHGNLTPANVILTRDGLRVTDFGVAGQITSTGEPAEIAAAADNPGWLAPELLTGGPVDPACDVFAWGCLVAFAATGHSPYTDVGHGSAGLDTGALDESLRLLVGAAADADPAARPSAADLAAALEALFEPEERPATGTPGSSVMTTSTISPVSSASRISTVVTGVAPVSSAIRRRRPRPVRARAAVSALVVLAALFLAVPAGEDHVAAPPPRVALPDPPEGVAPALPSPVSNTAAMSAYDAPPAPPVRAPARPTRRTGSRPPHTVIWMSCPAHSAICSAPRVTSSGPPQRPSGWLITWPAIG